MTQRIHRVLTMTLAVPVGLALAAGASPTLAQAVLLHNVRVIDGNGGAPLEHVDIRIEDGRIVSIGKAGTRGSRARGSPAQDALDATVVDLTGKTAVPGLISDHSHLGLVEGTSAGGRNVTAANILRQLRQYQAYGVTTVTALGLNTDAFYELQPQLHDGSLPGADIFGADRGFGVVDAAPPAAMGILDTQVYRPRTPEEARAEVREAASRHPSLLKIWVDDFHGAVPTKMDPRIYAAIIEEAHATGLRVAAHVFYLDDAKRLVNDGIDVLAHGVRDRAVDSEFVDAMKARHVWYIPTLVLDEAFYLFAEQPDLLQQTVLRRALQPALAAQLADPAWRAKVLGDTQKHAQDQAAFEMNLRNIKSLYDAGVKIGFGTDSGATPLRIAGFAEHRELLLLTRAGLTPLQALGTATKNAAALLELDDRGVLEAGKRADIVIVDGNPAKNIADIDRIVAVWHAGKPVSGALAAFSP